MLNVHSVGPQTGSRILAKMHTGGDDFYKDLLGEKIHYPETRRFWDDR
ncbi:hypothetical protein MUP77_10390 [Candidatus Bathyarchaeota archaeon]|nr:hypothetical protein [Candidatus Bathyarchaeota archaeon]